MSLFYVAASLSNRAAVCVVADTLKDAGHEHTYDWTRHGSLKGDVRVLPTCAQDELQGVKDADFVVALLPGGRGTHVEIGAALALNKRVYLVTDGGLDPGGLFREGDQTCAFYHHHRVVQIDCDTLSHSLDIIRRKEAL